MKLAIAAATLALVASSFALEGAFLAALAVPQMGGTPALATGAAAPRAEPSRAEAPPARARTACAAAGEGC